MRSIAGSQPASVAVLRTEIQADSALAKRAIYLILMTQAKVGNKVPINNARQFSILDPIASILFWEQKGSMEGLSYFSSSRIVWQCIIAQSIDKILE